MGLKHALLAATLRNAEGTTHNINVVGSLPEVTQVCHMFGLVPDWESLESPSDDGVVFFSSATGSFATMRPVDQAGDIIVAMMTGGHAPGCDCDD